MKKLYIDCSYLSNHPHLNTGIQRVVRKIVEGLFKEATSYGFQPILVSLRDSNATILPLDAIAHRPLKEAQNKAQTVSFKKHLIEYLKNLYLHTKLWFSALIPSATFRHFMMAPKNQFGLNYILYHMLYHPIKSIFSFSNKPPSKTSKNGFPFEVSNTDTLLLIDSSWYMNIWESVHTFKQKGGRVEMVLYDLIPIAYPQFCDAFLAKVFKEWVDESLGYVDGYIAISKTVQKEIMHYAQTHAPKRAKTIQFGYFYLGADFQSTKTSINENIRDSLKELMKERPTFITVSTLEPRKNHAYLLDTFEQLWDDGIDINLLLIGRQGWLVDELLKRIKNHSEYNKRLFFFDDINDTELDYAYHHAKALLFASFVEGFGLPIIEGLEKGLPVFASDIPVHREIGKNAVIYFNLNDKKALAKTIYSFLKEPFSPPLKHKKWINWDESTHMLLQVLMNHSPSTSTSMSLQAKKF